MDLKTATRFFEDLGMENVYAGTNYMIDEEDNIFEAMCWANGGFAWVKKFTKNESNYYYKREIALLRKDTIFKQRN